MLKFANAKINIGLHITQRRSDGYHELETVFYPVKLYDAVEVVSSEKLELKVWNSSLNPDEDNLCLKAYHLLAKEFKLAPVQIHLLKNIPIGAGLGGGSSDASTTLLLLNEYFNLGITTDKLKSYAAMLGADCPFFIENKAMYGQGIGTNLSAVSLDLSNYQIVVIKPDVHISTKEAYENVIPLEPEVNLQDAIKLPVQEWKYIINNNFEVPLFDKYPQIGDIKTKLYEKGAIYASMSGSGSAVYGIFDHTVSLKELTKYGSVYFPAENI